MAKPPPLPPRPKKPPPSKVDYGPPPLPPTMPAPPFEPEAPTGKLKRDARDWKRFQSLVIDLTDQQREELLELCSAWKRSDTERRTLLLWNARLIAPSTAM